MRFFFHPLRRLLFSCWAVLFGALALLWVPFCFGQQSAAGTSSGGDLRGCVLDASGHPVSGALVRLERTDGTVVAQATASASGNFVFSSVDAGQYQVTAEASGVRSRTVMAIVPSRAAIRLMLQAVASPQSPSAAASQSTAMQFSDQPDFTIAGVTDWTAVGGHGSDANLRTSEDLARETLALKPRDGATPTEGAGSSGTEMQLRAALAASPGNFEANHRLGEFYLHNGDYRQSLPLLESAWRIDPKSNANTLDLALACRGAGDLRQARAHVAELLARGNDADWLRLAGDLDEALGNPLAAVQDYQRAVEVDPSEQNTFAWGSELLLHRAIWEAQEVFRKGAGAYPSSVRMQTAYGAALFAGALYDQAALRLCAASDLDPGDAEPYIFMGQIEIAAPNPLPCIEQKLARFAQTQPANSTADYLYAMTILKTQERSPQPHAVDQAEALFHKAVAADGRNARAWFELGNLAAARRDFAAAIDMYRKAIDADPQLSDAYYRLGVAYDRSGEADKARQEFLLHDQIAKTQAEAVDRERRSIQQFLFAPSSQSAPLPTH